MKVVSDGREGMPLRAAVFDGCLVFSIGIETLAFAFHHSENNNPFDGATNEHRQLNKIEDPLIFAEDTCQQMNGEGEDGSTPLTRFMDSMMDYAVEHGSLGIADPEENTDAK